MIVEFSNHRGEPARQGPFDRLRLTSSELLDDVNHTVIARQQDQFWKVESDGRSYGRFDCVGQVRMRFESESSQSRNLGPFREFSSLDGVTYVGPRIFAFFDREHGDWYSYDLGSHWTGFIIEPAV